MEEAMSLSESPFDRASVQMPISSEAFAPAMATPSMSPFFAATTLMWPSVLRAGRAQDAQPPVSFRRLRLCHADMGEFRVGMDGARHDGTIFGR